MPTELALLAARLVSSHRWAALATVHEGGPLASMVAYAGEKDLSALFFHLSGLSAHTRDLLADGRASLCVGEADPGTGDPQTLARLTLTGRTVALEEGTPPFDAARRLYLARFPDAEMRFELPDFVLFVFVPEEGRVVGGFARAGRVSPEQLSEAATSLG
ncbi:MAG TPA: pyridoxamine 5'-phosphate oxidase family protein [Thermoanaerobaculia bacterium]|nr:pyridoxamine 5'-phosphate oxidase family protein [Thermoanaerobaculia bacterium]